MAILMLMLVLPGWSQPSENILQLADTTEIADKAIDGVADQNAGRHMDIGRFYIGRRDYAAALNRLKIVVTQFQTSRYVEEALARLTEAYLALGIASEARIAAEMLRCKFPNGHWFAEAQAALKAAGIEPDENKSCSK